MPPNVPKKTLIIDFLFKKSMSCFSTFTVKILIFSKNDSSPVFLKNEVAFLPIVQSSTSTLSDCQVAIFFRRLLWRRVGKKIL